MGSSAISLDLATASILKAIDSACFPGINGVPYHTLISPIPIQEVRLIVVDKAGRIIRVLAVEHRITIIAAITVIGHQGQVRLHDRRALINRHVQESRTAFIYIGCTPFACGVPRIVLARRTLLPEISSSPIPKVVIHMPHIILVLPENCVHILIKLIRLVRYIGIEIHVDSFLLIRG